jgi:hypothetical protein
VLQWLDAPKQPEQRQAANENHMCDEHGVPFMRHEKNGDVWWSHPLPNGKHHRMPEPDRPQQRGNNQRRGSRQQRGPR